MKAEIIDVDKTSQDYTQYIIRVTNNNIDNKIIRKRYNDFLKLDKELGNNKLSKNWWENGKNDNIIEKRIKKLNKYMNTIIKDKSDLVINFLEVTQIKEKENDFPAKKNDNIEEDDWNKEYKEVQEMLIKLDNKEEGLRIRSKLIKLRDDHRFKETPRRKLLLNVLSKDLDEAIGIAYTNDVLPPETTRNNNTPVSGRVLGNRQEMVIQRTKQDGELEILAESIKRQKLISQEINRELEQQNELLDEFHDDVAQTGHRLHKARNQADRFLAPSPP